MSSFLISKKNTLYLAMQIAFFTSIPMFTQLTYAVENNQDGTDQTTGQQLPVITLTADSRPEAVTEKSGSYTTQSTNTATKIGLSLRETPQAVKVYTREYLDDRNIESFQDLMNAVTGVTASRTDERQSYFARGFQIDYFLIDGIPTTLSLSEGDLDLGIFDRVEVVKGANGLMTGAGNPAVGLNLVRKHANAKELTANVTASAGSWNSYSSSADISSALNEDGSLRGRAYVKHSNEDSFMDFYSKERNIAYAAIDYDFSDSTTLSLAANYQQLERKGIRWGGLPAFYTDGTRTDFSKSLTVSSDWTYWNVDSTALFASIKQKLYNDVALNVAYSYRRDDTDTALLYVAGKVDKATNKSVGAVSVYSSDVRNDENNVDVYISAPFTIAGRDQEIVLGGSWNKKELLKNNYGTIQGADKDLNINTPNQLDFSNINTQLLTPITNPKKLALNQTTQNAAYIAAKFQILDPLKVVAGARLSKWEFEASDHVGNREFDNELTPYIGVVYDFAKDHSWYASHTSIFKPQSRRNEQGDYLDPMEGKNYETGIKSEFFGGHLNTALSVFRIEQTNFAELITDSYVHVNGNMTTEQAYKAIDGVVSKGFEFEADGEINDNWGINFGVANFEAKDAKGEKVATTSSRTTSNLFVKYKMNDQLNAGVGLNYRSKTYSGTGLNRIEQDDLWLASLMLGYKIDQNFGVQLNVDNLFDKEYFDGIGANSMNYAAPRNATLTLRYNF
ncbi:TonB-dependent siderophore receptor [Acinetobacter sp. ANC 3832]|uniref:TonB-dependent siderophore receptor n=1 Tax=Acinetobacter sp. ANC 3832 TaxID=1977874 RepID=UPI000A356D4F|nr:TonB-dependent siderophore receptor [Acinetobacter sp. ANC 3832]OTG92572.1 TonB-dependent siderophore receptor [Acinetobacter sp. ANC 3832]